MTAAPKIHVQIGEVKTAGPGSVLTAILGSCIGIGFLWPERKRFGLAHCLLADSGGHGKAGGARHVDQAIDSLKDMLEVTPADRRKVEIFLAGGANMTMPADTPQERLVGSHNAEFAKKAVRAAGLRLSYEDLGGLQGRQVTIDCSGAKYTISAIPRLGA